MIATATETGIATAAAAPSPARPPRPPPRPTEGRTEQRPTPRAQGHEGSRRREVPALAREVVTSLLSRATGPINPSFIKEALVRKHPDFDERDHGFSSFSRLLEALEKEGLCQRIQQGRQWYVVAKDHDGAPRGPATAHPHDAQSQQEALPLHDAPSHDEAPEPDEESIPDPED